MTLTNADIAELLAREADEQIEQKAKACRTAARAAFKWPEEVGRLLAESRSLTELNRVGPWTARLIESWIEAEVPAPEPPDLRADFLTLTDSQAILATDPSWERRFKGDLQMHSVYSDGGGTVADMANAGIERGYEYVSITDHSKGLKIAGGMDENRLADQGREIDALNDELAARGQELRVLKSIEMNLGLDGSGDMEPDSLAALDLVVGSFHSKLRLKDDQTDRYIAGLRNPHLHILGHPRGRMYNFRLGLTADWPRVFDTAAELDKAVEIDGFPDRQDLNMGLLRIAARSGCRVSIDTDSHQPWQLMFATYALAAALDAGIPADRVVNFMPMNELKDWAASIV